MIEYLPLIIWGAVEYQKRPRELILDRELARQLESREPLC
jgi:hypothetical protein